MEALKMSAFCAPRREVKMDTITVPKTSDLLRVAKINPKEKKLGKALKTWFEIQTLWASSPKGRRHQLDAAREDKLFLLRDAASDAGYDASSIIDAVQDKYGPEGA